MTVLNDKQILAECDNGMITPFERGQVKQWHVNGEPVVSYGTSSFGYDARLSCEFKEPVAGVLDPKQPELTTWRSWEQDGRVVMPPHSFYLARTIEYFRVPHDVLSVCLGKSTYARGAIVVNVTPLEPGWEGHVTLELSNTADVPSVVYVGEGICQFIFYRGKRPAVTYSDRGGKYMNQSGVTLARV